MYIIHACRYIYVDCCVQLASESCSLLVISHYVQSSSVLCSTGSASVGSRAFRRTGSALEHLLYSLSLLIVLRVCSHQSVFKEAMQFRIPVHEALPACFAIAVSGDFVDIVPDESVPVAADTLCVRCAPRMSCRTLPDAFKVWVFCLNEVIPADFAIVITGHTVENVSDQ